jgi:hypothetical protein
MSLHAGAARRDISPVKPVQLCGYPHVPRVSTGIHDPLLASVLYLSNGSSAVLLCALDLLMLNCNVVRQIRRSVANALGMAESGVLISCTHTHSAPVTLHYLPFSDDTTFGEPDPAYLTFVEKQVVEAAVAAKNKSQPAELAWTSADARGVGGNRHFPDGPTDPDAGVLAVRSGGKLLAVTLIYGMHPTVMHEDSTLVSSDFIHYARVPLQEKFGSDLVVVYHTAAAGNQSPRYQVKGQTFAEAERLGRMLGVAAVSSLQNLQFTDNPVLAGKLQAVELQRRQFPSVADAEKVLTTYRADYQHLKATGAERPRVRTAEVAVFGAEALSTLARKQQSGEVDRRLDEIRPFEVQVLRIGAVAIAALPGEFFVEYGLDLKARAAMKSYLVTYANGELQGYIVTPAAVAAGGYEAASSMFPPQAGASMVNTALELISQLAS